MDQEQQERFGRAVERKKADADAKARRLQGDTPRDPDVDGGRQPDLTDADRPQEVLSPREKSTGKGKKTADKWNQ